VKLHVGGPPRFAGVAGAGESFGDHALRGAVGGTAQEVTQGLPDEKMEADEMGERISGQTEDHTARGGAENKRLAGTDIDLAEMNLHAEMAEEFRAEIVRALAGAARDEEEIVGGRLHLIEHRGHRLQVVADMQVVDRPDALLAAKRGDEGGVAVPDLSRFGLGFRRDDFVPGGEVQDAGEA